MNRLRPRLRHPRSLLLGLLLLAAGQLCAQRDTIRTRVDLVVVPASVRDGSGKLVYDLKPEEFQILEDGRPQEIRSVAVDPLPLSVAILVDTGVGGSPLRRFANAIVSLSSAFTAADEAEIYRFDHIVSKLSDFTSSAETMEKSLASIKRMAEGRPDRADAIPILAGRGPRWLRRWFLLDTGLEYRNLNDPLFASVAELDARSPERRKVVLIVSDGQVADDATWLQKGSTIHSVKETQQRLIQSQVQVYGVAVGNALLQGRTTILHSYASATGGDVYRAGTQNAMDRAFSQIMEQARHQYVLSYVSNNEVTGQLGVVRKIEVKSSRPGLKVNHRKSYLQYPLSRQ